MTPKERAEDLLITFGIPPLAIKAVDLLLSELPNTLPDDQCHHAYWEYVKEELEKL